VLCGIRAIYPGATRHTLSQQRRMKDDRRKDKIRYSRSLWSPTMPKHNARENMRNRMQAKKRARNRALRAKLQAPVQATQLGNSSAVAKPK
jgi:hypothetical protein